MFAFVEFDSQVEACHGKQLKAVLINSLCAASQVPIEVAHGDTDNLTVQIEVIDDYKEEKVICKEPDKRDRQLGVSIHAASLTLISPLANLLAPVLVDLR
jgi:hypothetical protein